MLGMHGLQAANEAVQKSDLLVVLGARFDDRVTGKLSGFAPLAKVLHIDVDACELGKVRGADVALASDLKPALEALCWRQGTSVPSDAPLEATTRVKLPARNLTDDEAIEMRRIHSSCPDQRPGCEYV